MTESQACSGALYHDGCRCSSSGSSSSALLFIAMLVEGMEYFLRVSGVVISYVQKVTFWVRYFVGVVPNINHEVLPIFLDNLCWDIRGEIIRKW